MSPRGPNEKIIAIAVVKGGEQEAIAERAQLMGIGQDGERASQGKAAAVDGDAGEQAHQGIEDEEAQEGPQNEHGQAERRIAPPHRSLSPSRSGPRWPSAPRCACGWPPRRRRRWGRSWRP